MQRTKTKVQGLNNVPKEIKKRKELYPFFSFDPLLFHAFSSTRLGTKTKKQKYAPSTLKKTSQKKKRKK